MTLDLGVGRLGRDHRLLGLQVGIILGDGEEAHHRALEGARGGQMLLHLARFLRRIILHRGGALLGDARQQVALVLHEAAGDLQDVGQKVVALAQLHVDRRQRLQRLVAPFDERHVPGVEDDAQQNDDGDDDPQRGHARSPSRVNLPALYGAAACRLPPEPGDGGIIAKER